MDEQSAQAMGRAFLGALAGVFVVLIAAASLGIGILRGGGLLASGWGTWFLVNMAGVGACLGAVFGMFDGVRRIRGKADSRIKGVLWGCSFGILGGALLGYLAGPGKVWATATALGIFVGGLGGAIHGAAVSPKRKKSESMPQAGGVVDRELDG